MLSSRPLKSAVLAVALMAGGCDRQSGGGAQPSTAGSDKQVSGELDRSHKGEPLPDLLLTDPDGIELRLSDLAGTPVLINLWATWCAPCVTELPTLNRIANRKDSTVQVVTVSQDSGDPVRVRAFLDERGLAQLPAWLDPENNLTFHYKSGTLPTTVLYDADGKELWRYVGGREWDRADALKLIAEAERAMP